MDPTMYRLKVTLRGSRPPIWRRLEVRGDVTLFQVHQVLQVAMGWTDSHLHQFRRGTTYYGESDPEFGEPRENERRIRLSESTTSTPASEAEGGGGRTPDNALHPTGAGGIVSAGG